MLSACRALTCHTLPCKQIQQLVHTSVICHAGRQWRLQKGESGCANEYGPLTDIPDWSYADGRPAPLGFKEKMRREKQEVTGKRIVQLMGEMKQAKIKNAARLQEQQAKMSQEQKAKLKPRTQR